jgi:hypothetical protein
MIRAAAQQPGGRESTKHIPSRQAKRVLRRAQVASQLRLRQDQLCSSTSSTVQQHVGPWMREPMVNKSPKTRKEIQDMVTAELRRFADCAEAAGVVVVGLDDEISGATWTVSRFNRGESDAHACDRALQAIVPHYQRLYDLKQKH